MASTEANFSFTTKIGSDLFTVRGDTVDEFTSNLRECLHSSSIDFVKALQEAITSGTAHVPAPQQAAPPPPTTPVVDTAPPASTGGIEVVTNKYGAKFTYGHPDAPDLEDGRGKYIQKDWITAKGERKRAWVDPTDGPKPAKPGASKAATIWIN